MTTRWLSFASSLAILPGLVALAETPPPYDWPPKCPDWGWSGYDMPQCEAGTCLFRVQTDASTVEVLGEWDDWTGGAVLLPDPDQEGWFEGSIDLDHTQVVQYKLKLDGEWALDPSNRYVRFGPFGFNNAISPPGVGRLTVLADVASPQLGNTRDVYVWLPGAYFETTWARFDVLYMQDGFNVFENPATAFGSWEVDATADALGARVIIVGIDTSDRAQEYLYTWVDLGAGPTTPKLDLYTAFVGDTLVPLVNGSFRTKKGAEHTGIAGSSFGGISSMYMAWTRPDVFGRVGSLSGSYWVGQDVGGEAITGGPTLQAIITENAGGNAPSDLRIYLDSGDSSFDGSTAYASDGRVYTDHTRNALIALGWDNRPEWDTDGDLATPPDNLDPSTPAQEVPALWWSNDVDLAVENNLLSVVGQGHAHNEAAWRERFAVALRFLFPDAM